MKRKNLKYFFLYHPIGIILTAYLAVLLFLFALGIAARLDGQAKQMNAVYETLKPIIYALIPITLAIYCVIRYRRGRKEGENKSIYLLVLLLCIPAEILVIDRNNAEDYAKFNKEIVKNFGEGYAKQKYWKEESITYHLIGNVRRNRRKNEKKEARMLEEKNKSDLQDKK